MRTVFLLCLCGCLLTLSSCSKREKTAAASRDEPRQLLDACALLTREEVTGVLGGPVQETKPSNRGGDGVAISQCYFVLPTNADSINVILTQRVNSASPRDPRAVWQAMFLDERPAKIGRDGKQKEPPRPERIAGLGEDAFWAGGRFGGTLNVLQGDAVVQIAVGGSGDEAAKLEKLKELAQILLQRLAAAPAQ